MARPYSARGWVDPADVEHERLREAIRSAELRPHHRLKEAREPGPRLRLGARSGPGVVLEVRETQT